MRTCSDITSHVLVSRFFKLDLSMFLYSLQSCLCSLFLISGFIADMYRINISSARRGENVHFTGCRFDRLERDTEIQS